MLDVPRGHVATALERVAQQRDAANPESWALVVSLHAYPEGDAGAEALARLAMAARGLGAPVIASAPVSFAGRRAAVELDDDTPPEAAPEVYALIRRSLEARFLGLTFPRLLLRAPYGRENPCDTIEFEEIDDPSRHEDYLWGSGAAAVALLVGEAFNERGWAIGPRMPLDIGSLPYFMYRRGPETVALSCAETIMSERIARHLLSRGLMPIAWIKNTDRVRVVEMCSVADPTAPLAAAWNGSASGADR
jgi:type VI secretion system protein ImpC